MSGSGATGEPPRPAGGAGSPRRSDGGGSAPSTADGRPDSPKPERAAIGPLTEDLRCAERATRHLNRLLGGAAGEDPDNRGRLWSDVEQAWQRHVVDEEPLIERVAPVLDPSRVLSLITLLRRPVGHSLTRPHPMLLHGGWPTGLAIRAQYRIDECRDVLDNRVSWRTGR